MTDALTRALDQGNIPLFVGSAKGPASSELHAVEMERAQSARMGRAERKARRLEAALGELLRARSEEEVDQSRDQLGDLLSAEDGTDALARWLAGHWDTCVKESPGKMAIVLNAAVQCGVAGLGAKVAQVLEVATDQTLLRVAAQRARHVVFTDDSVRLSAWAAFQRRLPALADHPTVLPSAAHLGLVDAIPWLLERYSHKDPLVVDAAAVGLLDLACKHSRPPARLDDTARERISQKTLERLAKAQDAATASLVWLLGSVSTRPTLDGITAALAHAFVAGRTLEKAAAARAAANLVREDFAVAAIEALKSAISREDEAELDRFVCLAVRGWER